MTAYQTTMVSVSKSQEEIRKILRKADTKGVQFSENWEDNIVNIRFAKKVGDNFHTVSISMKIPKPPESKRKRKSSQRYNYAQHRFIYNKTPEEKNEQMERATYRALHYWLKSQFEAVEFGLLTFEDVFMSHFEWIMPDGTKGTLGMLLKPQFNQPALESGEIEDVVEGKLV